jgi:hypothetical protein
MRSSTAARSSFRHLGSRAEARLKSGLQKHRCRHSGAGHPSLGINPGRRDERRRDGRAERAWRRRLPQGRSLPKSVAGHSMIGAEIGAEIDQVRSPTRLRFLRMASRDGSSTRSVHTSDTRDPGRIGLSRRSRTPTSRRLLPGLRSWHGRVGAVAHHPALGRPTSCRFARRIWPETEFHAP